MVKLEITRLSDDLDAMLPVDEALMRLGRGEITIEEYVQGEITVEKYKQLLQRLVDEGIVRAETIREVYGLGERK